MKATLTSSTEDKIQWLSFVLKGGVGENCSKQINSGLRPNFGGRAGVGGFWKEEPEGAAEASGAGLGLERGGEHS